MRKMNEKDREYLVFDELPRVRPCLLAAVDSAEAQDIGYYGLLSPHFYYIVRNGLIETCIDRSTGTATRLWIRKWLARFKVLEPRYEMQCP